MGTILRVPYKMLAAPMPAEKIVHEKTSLLLLDFQKFTCDRTCGLGSLAMIKGITPEFVEYYSMVDSAKTNCRSLVETCRHNSIQVVFCYLHKTSRNSHHSRQFEINQYPLPSGGLEDEYLSDLSPAENDLVIARDTYSPFLNTGLEDKLQVGGIETLIVTGTLYNYTVALAAREAADRGFNVIVVWDASAAETLDWHLVTRTGLVGGLILSRRTQEVIEMVEGRRT